MTSLANCFALTAPYYNLALVIILLCLFIYLLKIPNKKKVYTTPWQLLFIALIIFLVEEIITVLKFASIIKFPNIIFGIFEMSMIILFIQMTLLQKDNLKK